jgi:hypothetical protein
MVYKVFRLQQISSPPILGQRLWWRVRPQNVMPYRQTDLRRHQGMSTKLSFFVNVLCCYWIVYYIEQN